MATRVVTAHLPQELAEKRQRETLAALDDVDSGRIAEHAEVEAWTFGLGQLKKSRTRSQHAS
jgi:predicted transcriptional regulator